MADAILIVLMLTFAVSGYRQGFVIGALALGGFFSGLLIGLQVAPLIANRFAEGAMRLVVALAVILVLAILGQTLAGWLGTSLRRVMQHQRLQRLDDAGGVVISVFAFLLFAWLIAVPLGSTPFPTINRAVRESVILDGVNSVMPERVEALTSALRDSLNTDGFPDVFDGLTRTRARAVPEPDPALRDSKVVAQSEKSVLKVLGAAPSCSRRIEGTGFVYASERVMTNAHVVAGTREVTVDTERGKLEGTVVVYDPKRDLAVLHVPGLRAPIMEFAGKEATTGANAIVLGYPQDGPYNAQSARVSDVSRITGPDIYDSGDVTREIYTIRSLVQSGNSGGPLITPTGDVLGVIFAAAADDKNVGFALTAEEAAPVARQGARSTREVRTGECA